MQQRMRYSSLTNYCDAMAKLSSQNTECKSLQVISESQPDERDKCGERPACGL